MLDAGSRLLAAGVTAVQDMSHTNGRHTHRFLVALAEEAGFAPRLLPSAEGWAEGRAPRARSRRPVKVMLRELGAQPQPDSTALAGIVRSCAERGRAVAVHAVERSSVRAVVEGFEMAGTAADAGQPRHRIEHAGVCPPELAERIGRLGIVVVSNPGFLHDGGERYRQRVAAADLANLYAAGLIHAAGAPLAFASDAPVMLPDPLVSVRTAVTRRDSHGAQLPGAGLGWREALAAHTAGGAFAAGVEHEIGCIRTGMRADLAVLSQRPEEADVAVQLTVLGGEVVWQRGT
jgi:predicted amidohydrolase YtcJ